MNSRSLNILVCLGLMLAAGIVYTRALSWHGLEYRDDEIFYYRSTQEMLSSGNYLSATYFHENRFQKPILYYWMILLFYKLFGVGWASALMVAVVLGQIRRRP